MKTQKKQLAAYTIVLALACTAVQGQEVADRSPHRIRAGIVLSESTTWDDDGQHSDEVGFGLMGEYLFTDRVGLGYGGFTTRVDPWYASRIDHRMTPIMVTAMFHMTPGRVVDFYLGPGLSWVHFSGGEDGRELDDDHSPHFQIGFDVLPKGSPFGFNLDIKHILHTGNHGSDFHSVNLGLGFVVRF